MMPMASAAVTTEISEAPKPEGGVQTLWEDISEGMNRIFGGAVYNSWLTPLVYREFVSGRFVVAAPTRFMRDWVRDNCGDQILGLLQQKNPSVLSLDLIVDSSLGADQTSKLRSAPQNLVTMAEPESDSELSGSRLEPRYVFDNFVVGKSNEFAYAAARRVAEEKEIVFNPLFLHGGVGLGKTHLMHAIAWHIRKHRPDRKVIYLSAEKFMYHFIRALKKRDTVTFKKQFRSVDVLMIDDFQFISGKDATQEEFFHTFNALVDEGRQVIMSADKSPSEMDGLEERMHSRLGSGLVADVHPTTYELRLGILEAKCETGHHNVPSEILEFLAQRISSNVRELEGAFNRIIAHSTLMGREIDIDSVRNILGDVLRSNDRRVSVEEIQKQVAAHYNIRLSDIHSARRVRTLARPRQVAMYLAKHLTSLSLPEIGRKFGGRDHTTVMHGVRKVEGLRDQDASLSEDLDLLTRMLQG